MKEQLRYPSDEELERLIAEVEQGRIVKAPVYLKEQITDEVVKVNKEIAAQNKKASAKRQFFLYSTKIVVAAAAAIFVLTIMPMGLGRSVVLPNQENRGKRIEEQIKGDMLRYNEGRQEAAGEKNNDKYKMTSFLNEKTNQLCNRLNDFSKLLIVEERSYD